MYGENRYCFPKTNRLKTIFEIRPNYTCTKPSNDDNSNVSPRNLYRSFGGAFKSRVILDRHCACSLHGYRVGIARGRGSLGVEGKGGNYVVIRRFIPIDIKQPWQRAYWKTRYNHNNVEGLDARILMRVCVVSFVRRYKIFPPLWPAGKSCVEHTHTHTRIYTHTYK